MSEPETFEPAASLRRSTIVMVSGTATSRVLGFVRNALLVAAIGVNVAGPTNAFDAANKIPNILYALLASGLLNSVLVPQVVRAFARKGGKETVDRIVTLGIVFMFGVTVLLTVGAAWLIALLYTEGSPELVALAVAFAFWCIPQLFFYGLYTLLGQVLNAREQFGPYMWAPVVNNIVAIGGLTAYLAIFGPAVVNGVPSEALETPWSSGQIALLAGTATLGVAVQALVLIIPLVRGGYHWRWRLRGAKGELDGVKRVAGWTTAAVLVEQAGVAWTTRIASAAGDVSGNAPDIAANAAYTQALLLYLVPHSLVTVSIVTAMFTGMSRFAAAHDMAGLRAELSRGLRTIAIFSVFAATALIVLAPLAVRIVLPVALDAEIRSVANVLIALSFGLVPLGAMVLVKKVYYALEDGRSVFVIHIPMTIALVGISLAGKALLDVRWWVVGVGAALAASNVIAMALRLGGLRRRLGGLDGRRVARTHLLAVAAALPAAAAGWGLLKFAPNFDGLSRWTAFGAAGAWVAGLGVVMLAVYATGLWAFRVDEWRDAARPLLRKLGVRVR